MILKVVLILAIVQGLSFVLGKDSSRQSEVKTIHVPYQSKPAVYPYPFARSRQVRKVMLPVGVDNVPNLVLNEKMGTAQAPVVKFLDGAYPVYYTTGKANGHFNGMISVLDK